MSFDYNTTRKKLVLPEYGRNTQMMVDHMMAIEDREERTKAAYTIIGIMGNLNPHLRDTADYHHKLWDHLAMMTDFKLDIETPYELPSAEILEEKPNTIPYNSNNIRFKHYGKNVEGFIQYAVQMEEGEEKDKFVEMLANHMKKLFLTHNRESVPDAQILSDLNELSKGQLTIPGDISLMETKDILNKNKKKKPVIDNKKMNKKRNNRN